MYYNQRAGVAMGSPPGPLQAGIYVAKLKNQQLKSTIEQLVWYHFCVDDIFYEFDDHIIPSDILDAFFGINKTLRFTLNVESNKIIPILDIVLTTRQDGSLSRSKDMDRTVKKKLSFVPLSRKRSLIKCLSNTGIHNLIGGNSIPRTSADEIKLSREWQFRIIFG